MHVPHASSRGFTLIELLITIAIAGILVMIGAPAMGNLLARTQEASAETSLTGALQQARTDAVTHGNRVRVCPSSDGRHCQAGTDWQYGWIVFDDADQDGQPDATAKGLSVFAALPAGTRIITSAGRREITFQPSGSAGGSNVSFTICHARQHDGTAVVVSNSGRVRIADPEPASLQQCLAGIS